MVTTIVDVPAVAVSVVVNVIVSWVDDATVVASLVPLKVAVVLALKFVPVMVNVGEVLVSVDVGLMVEMVGTGLLTVSVCEPDVPPPGVGLVTVIECVPPTAISVDNIVAVS